MLLLTPLLLLLCLQARASGAPLMPYFPHPDISVGRG